MSNITYMGDGKIDTKAVDGYLETRDISDLLGITISTVHYWLRKGELVGDSGNCIKNQRKKVAVGDFKKFLNNNPKYYEIVYGTPLILEEPVPAIEAPEFDFSEDSEVLTELFDKMELVEAMLKRHKETVKELNKTIEELEAKKTALEKVIDMF